LEEIRMKYSRKFIIPDDRRLNKLILKAIKQYRKIEVSKKRKMNKKVGVKNP